MPAAKMIAALDTIEAGLQQLAPGVTTFTAALQVVSGAMYPDHNRMRVTTVQKKALTDAANRAGLELSAWLRQLALRAAGALPEAKES